MSDDKELFHKICGMIRGDGYATLNDLVYAIIDTVDAARAQGGEAVGFIPDSGLNNLKARHPARIYPVGSTPSPFEHSTLLYTHPSASVPDDVTEAWSKIKRYFRGSVMESADTVKMVDQYFTTTLQPADGWIKCSERLPAEADGSLVWSHDQKRGTVELCSWAWSHSLYKHGHITHWMPTDLKRPTPPEQGAE